MPNSSSYSSIPVRLKRLPKALGFDWVMLALFTWLTLGANLDAWAHNHIANLETFFTPWHAVLYSGVLTLASFLLITLFGNHLKGLAWRKALPVGYNLSLMGIMLMGLGGIADLGWHSLFGVETTWESVFSSSHLLLALGAGLVVTGPLRAAWQRSEIGAKLNWLNALPVLISLSYFLSELGLFSWYSHPFSTIYPASHYPQLEFDFIFSEMVGVSGILFQSTILVSWLLVMMRRWLLPFGSYSFVLGLSYGLMIFTRDTHLEGGAIPWLVVVGLAGLATDWLWYWLKPSSVLLWQLRLMAFSSPVILYSLYFGMVGISAGGIGWSVPVWTGCILMAGIAGYLVSYLVFPPKPAT
jgi:hypothetical protein